MRKIKLKNIYANSEYSIRIKAPLMGNILTFYLVVVAAVVLYLIVRGNWSGIMYILPTSLLMGAILLILYRGNYPLASLILTYSMILANMGITLIFNLTEITLAQTSLIMMLAAAFSLVFCSDRKHLYIQFAMAVVTLASTAFRQRMSPSYSADHISAFEQLLMPLVIFPILLILLMIFRNIFDRVLKDALERIDVAERTSQQMKNLLQGSAKQIEGTLVLEQKTAETAQSAKKIEEEVELINIKADTLNDKFQLSVDSLNNIQKLMDELNILSEDQTSNITETGSVLEQMVASIRNVSAIIDMRVSTVEMLKSKADGGKSVQDKTRRSFTLVSTQLDSIRTMIKMISEISSKTNMLAMNAAIEAAHAGDRGRGFAVVAGEVRKLAESSAENAKLISLSLKELISAIEMVGTNIDEMGKTFHDIGSEVETVHMAIKEISSSAVELNRGSEEILLSTTRMNETTTRLYESVKDIGENEKNASETVRDMGTFVSDVTGGLQVITSGTGIISGAVNELIELSGNISRYSRELNLDILKADEQ